MRLTLLALLLSIAAFGQTVNPDCQQTVTFTATGTSTAFTNKPTTTGGTPCLYWVFMYFTQSATMVSVQMEGAADLAGAPTGSYTALTATSSTANPAVGANEGSAILCCDYYPWLRFNLGTFDGTNIIIRAYGWRNQPNPTAGGGGIASNVNVAQWGGTATTLGQKAMAASVPVVVASNQSNLPTNLAAVGGTAFALGQGTMAASIGVAIASNQGNVPVSQATASALNAQVQGAGASGATKAGNPVQIGGVFNTTQPTVTTGQGVELQASARGSLLVTPSVEGFPVTPAANSSVNLAQVGGTNTVTGGVAGTQGVGGTTASAGTNAGNPVKIAGVFNTTAPTFTNGQLGDVSMDNRGAIWVAPSTANDPCVWRTKSVAFINTTAGATLLTGTASNKTYLCSVQLVAAAATNVAIVEGTGTVCATNTGQLFGGATAATGWNFAANGGLTFGGANATVAVTTVNANNVCILVSAANQISGSFTYVTAP